MTEYGKNIKLRIYGGSHSPEIGLIAEHLPAGIRVDHETLQKFMERRAPGRNRYSTSRREPDVPEFLSGLTDNVTNGETLRARIRNTNQRSGDYSRMADIPRPSHADFAARVKFRDHGEELDLNGGGHFSGRLTAPLCILGGILKAELERRGIFIGAHIFRIADVPDIPFDPVRVSKADFDAVLANDFPVLDANKGERMREVIEDARMDLDSVGGVIECAVLGLPVGLGEHMFDGMEGRISQIVFGIPAVKGIEFGAGFASASLRGSQNNDPFVTDGIRVTTKTNNSGGIQGGMTNGMPVIFRAAIKPTASIAREQDSVNLRTMENTKLSIVGRHDPCIVPRAVPVMEAAAAIAIFDTLLDKGELEQ
ncbi:MAG: chorismate synthase [Eubacteriales bacterium]